MFYVTISVLHTQARNCPVHRQIAQYNYTCHFINSTYIHLISCESQLLKSFGLTRPGNRNQVYLLQGGHSNH